MPVAVLIVNYHVYDELDRALLSLAPFLDADDEVVVVDQESEAAQLEILRARHPRIQVVTRAENVGFAAGVNLAARATRAPYLLLLNPDAVVEGPVPRVLESWLRDQPRTAVAGPRVLNADGSVQPSARRFPGITAGLGGRSTWLSRRFPNNWISRRHLVGRRTGEPVDVDWLAGSCFMTRRDVFERAGGFDEAFFLYWEDADYCRRVTRLGLRCTYVPTVSVRHAAGRSSDQVRPLAVRAFHDSALHLYRKHAGTIGRAALPLVRIVLWIRREVMLRRAASQSEVRS